MKDIKNIKEVRSYRMNEIEFNKMKQMAHRNKMTVSALVRVAVLEYIKLKSIVNSNVEG